MTERVLAVRRDVVPLLAKHFVSLEAAVTTDELDASPRMIVREGAEEAEEVRIERLGRAGDAVGEKGVEARGVGVGRVQREVGEGMNIHERPEQRVRLGIGARAFLAGEPAPMENGRLQGKRSRDRRRGESRRRGHREGPSEVAPHRSTQEIVARKPRDRDSLRYRPADGDPP